jgi:hypothetical protein
MIRKPIRPRKGSLMIEAALCLVVLGPVIYSAARIGSGVQQVNALTAAVNDAAKRGATGCLDTEQIRNIALTGNVEGTGEPRVAGLERWQIQVEIDPESEQPSVAVGVRGFALRQWVGTQRLDGKPAATFPYPCEGD